MTPPKNVSFSEYIGLKTAAFVIQHTTLSVRIPRADGNQVEETRIISRALRDTETLESWERVSQLRDFFFLRHRSILLHWGLVSALGVGVFILAVIKKKPIFNEHRQRRTK